MNFDVLDGGSSVVRCRRFEANDDEALLNQKKSNPVNPISIELNYGETNLLGIFLTACRCILAGETMMKAGKVY